MKKEDISDMIDRLTTIEDSDRLLNEGMELLYSAGASDDMVSGWVDECMNFIEDMVA